MKNLSYFRNQYRERAGKPPTIRRNTQKQSGFIYRSRLIEYFKEKVNGIHATSYFLHPDDVGDLEKENSKINGMLKIFFSRCDDDMEKANAVVDFFSGEYGSWCGWKPSICFRKETVQDYETSLVIQKKKNKRDVWENKGKGVW